MRLGTHFVMREFLRSQTAARHGRQLPTPPPEPIKANLGRLVLEVLDPLRAEVGPITVLSGWRPEWLNKLVGGSMTSDHMAGRAADIVAVNQPAQVLCETIRRLDLPVKQCILEFPPNGWVHVSVPLLGVVPKREYLVARKEGAITRYSSWNQPKGE